MTSDRMDAMNYFYVLIDLCCFDENNSFLTELEAGSMEKILSRLSRFSVYENHAA